MKAAGRCNEIVGLTRKFCCCCALYPLHPDVWQIRCSPGIVCTLMLPTNQRTKSRAWRTACTTAILLRLETSLPGNDHGSFTRRPKPALPSKAYLARTCCKSPSRSHSQRVGNTPVGKSCISPRFCHLWHRLKIAQGRIVLGCPSEWRHLVPHYQARPLCCLQTRGTCKAVRDALHDLKESERKVYRATHGPRRAKTTKRCWPADRIQAYGTSESGGCNALVIVGIEKADQISSKICALGSGSFGQRLRTPIAAPIPGNTPALVVHHVVPVMPHAREPQLPLAAQTRLAAKRTTPPGRHLCLWRLELPPALARCTLPFARLRRRIPP